MFTGLWCVFAVVDSCFAYQKTTSERTADARQPYCADEIQGCQVQGIQEDLSGEAGDCG